MAQTIAFDLAVPVSESCVAGHFPDRALVPGALLCAALGDALEQRCGGQVERIDKLRLTAPVHPDDTLRVHCEPRPDGRWRLTVHSDGQAVMKGLFTLIADHD